MHKFAAHVAAYINCLFIYLFLCGVLIFVCEAFELALNCYFGMPVCLTENLTQIIKGHDAGV